MSIDASPRFTMALRGYDKLEVDEYLESRLRTAHTDEEYAELEEHSRWLESEQARLAARVEELEAAIRSETPRTVDALGQRLTLILHEAEEGASETLTKARAEADTILTQAKEEAESLRRQASAAYAEAAEHSSATTARADEQAAATTARAEEEAAAMTARAEEEARQIEAEAKSKAAAVLHDAEARGQRRQEKIEGWARQVIERTQAEQARMTDEFAIVTARHEAEVRALIGERDDILAALRALQSQLAHAFERFPSVRPAAERQSSGEGIGSAPGSGSGSAAGSGSAVGSASASGLGGQAPASASGEGSASAPGEGAPRPANDPPAEQPVVEVEQWVSGAGRVAEQPASARVSPGANGAQSFPGAG